MNQHAPRPIALIAPAVATALMFVLAPAASAQYVGRFASNVVGARGLAVDAAGRVYVSERAPASQIERCAPPDTTFSVFATGVVDPIDMVFDDGGNLFVADFDNGSTGGWVRKITPGGVNSVFATIPNPGAIARDAAGNLYVGEYFNRKIDKITPAGVVSTFVASIDAVTNRLTMLYMDLDGTLYAGMLGVGGTIYKIPPGTTTPVAFTSIGSCVGFTRASDGYFYASSYGFHELWKIDPTTGAATLFAGEHATPGLVEAVGTAARFYYPSGLLDLGGALYVAELTNHDIRSIAISGPTPARTSTWGRLKSLYR
jgi:hypothetical protein